jgi:hypothetical protein
VIAGDQELQALEPESSNALSGEIPLQAFRESFQAVAYGRACG